MRFCSQTRLPLVGLVLFLLCLGARAGQVQSIGSWQSVANMSCGRYAPTATPLLTGLVLVAGGYYETTPGKDSTGVCTPSAQLFDPSTQTWSETGPLATGRNFATATLLDNGQVMIAGGYNTLTGSLHSVEFYNPVTYAFTSNRRKHLKSPRELHTATKIPAAVRGAYAGKVLLVGGYHTGHGTLRSAEVYNPATHKFKWTGSMNTVWGRFGHSAVSLPNGDVLIVGGKERTPTKWNSLASLELFHASGSKAGTFETVGTLQYARDRPTAVWIAAAQQVLIIGGQASNGADVLPCEWFDPNTRKVSAGPSLAHGRMAHSATLLFNGDVLVVGGWTAALHGTTNTTERFVFDPTSATLGSFVSAGTLLDGYSCLDMGMASLSSNKVLIVGGTQAKANGGTYPPTAQVYTP